MPEAFKEEIVPRAVGGVSQELDLDLQCMRLMRVAVLQLHGSVCRPGGSVL